LAYGAPSKKEALLKAEIERRKKVITKQVLQIEVLKKTRSYSGQDRSGEETGENRFYDQGCVFWFRN